MFAALHRSGLRAVLAMLSVAVAIASITLALSLRTGARAQLDAVNDPMAAKLFVVKAAKVQALPGRGSGWFMSTRLNLRDASLLGAELQNAAAIVPVSEGGERVKFNGKSYGTTVRGVTPEYVRLRSFPLAAGRMLDELDYSGLRRVAVVGASVPRRLNDGYSMVGGILTISGITFEVVGQLAEKGMDATGQNEDDQVLIPTSTALQRLRNVQYLNSLLIQVNDPSELPGAQAQTRRLLRESHALAGAHADDFEILGLVRSNRIRARGAVFLEGLSGLFALITLAIGGGGVFAVAYLNVKDRTSEIGLRMAIGAKRYQIAQLFMAEACALSLIGGVVGLILGAAGVFTLRAFTDWQMSIGVRDVTIPFAIAAVLGLITGVLPALKAARMAPVQALRSA
jgi:putative ABC transport system permease protein